MLTKFLLTNWLGLSNSLLCAVPYSYLLTTKYSTGTRSRIDTTNQHERIIHQRNSMSTANIAGAMPTVPKGGWANTDTDTASTTSDLSSVPSSDTYLGLVAYKIQHGRAKEFAKGIDATQGKFYRSQPGCIAYMFGLSRQDEDTVLGTAIWSSKDLFESLPKNPKDLEKLNLARFPFKALVENMSIVETSVTFGIGHQKHSEATSEAKQASFDEIMGTYGRSSVLPAVPESNVYTVHVEMKTQPGKGEEVARGLEMTQGRFCE